MAVGRAACRRDGMKTPSPFKLLFCVMMEVDGQLQWIANVNQFMDTTLIEAENINGWSNTEWSTARVSVDATFFLCSTVGGGVGDVVDSNYVKDRNYYGRPGEGLQLWTAAATTTPRRKICRKVKSGGVNYDNNSSV